MRSLLVQVCLVVLIASPVRAQGGSDAGRRHELDLTVGVSQHFETALNGMPAGHFPMLDMQGRYARRSRESLLELTGATTDRYYTANGGRLIGSREAAAAFTRHLRRTTARVRGSIRHFPYVTPDAPAFGSLPPAVGASPIDDAVLNLSGVGHALGVEVIRQLDRRSALTASYDLNRSNFAEDAVDLRAQAIRAGYRRVLTRYAALRIGIGRQAAIYGAPAAGVATRTFAYDFDTGIDYSRPLLSRETTIGIRTGSSLVSGAAGRDLRLSGEASANHQFGRSSTARLFYRRGLEFVGGLTAPVFVNTLSAAAGTRLGRRLEGDLSGGASRGSAAVAGELARYSSQFIRVGLRTVLSPHLTFGTEYVYSRYRFAAALQVRGGGASPRRHGLQAGFTWRPGE